MEFATSKANRRLLHAKEASKFEIYRCPVCEGDVYLRRGLIKRAHFAHFSDSVSKDCELYTPGPGEYVPSLGAFNGHQAQRSPELRMPISIGIGISKSNKKSSDNQNKWSLMVTVPKSTSTKGTIEIDLGYQQLRKIFMSKLFDGELSFSANPDRKEFCAVKFSSAVPREYREGVSIKRPGLKKAKATAFVSSSSPIKPKANSIYCGENYYFVWSQELDSNFPEEIEYYPLENIGTWCCALVLIPFSMSKSTLDYLNNLCGQEIRPARRVLSFMWPFEYLNSARDDLSINEGQTALIGQFNPSNPDKIKTVFKVFDDQDNYQIEETEDEPPSFHLINFEGKKDIQVSVDSKHIANIRNSLKIDEIDLPKVEIQIEVNGKKTSSYLHTSKSKQVFENLRASRDRISGFSVSRFASGLFCWRERGFYSWENFEISVDKSYIEISDSLMKLDEETIEFMNEKMQSTSAEILMDFGALGKIFVSPPKKNDAESNAYFLPNNDVRQKVMWLVQQVNNSVPYYAGCDREQKDKKLIDAFLKLDVPVELSAHRKEIEKQFLYNSQKN